MKPSTIFWIYLTIAIAIIFEPFIFIGFLIVTIILQLSIGFACLSIFNVEDFKCNRNIISYYKSSFLDLPHFFAIKYNIFFYIAYALKLFNNYLNEKFS